MNTEIIASAVSEVLTNAALAVLSLVGAYAVYYIRLGSAKLKAQTARITDEAVRKALEDALGDVRRLAELSVEAMEQTTAKALREAVRAGTGDRGELLALGKQVFNEVKAQITPEAQLLIIKNLGGFDAYLTKCIESAVLKVKQRDSFPMLPGSVLVESGTEAAGE